MEYGQIFHVTLIGKYYCKNMKYRINYFFLRESGQLSTIIPQNHGITITYNVGMSRMSN